MMTTNCIVTVEMIEKEGPWRNEDYRAECYMVTTPTMDYWFSGFVSQCRKSAYKQFLECKTAGIPCSLVDALTNESIEDFTPHT